MDLSTATPEPRPDPVQPSADWLAESHVDEPIALTLAPLESLPVHPPELTVHPSETIRRFVQVLAMFLCLFLVVRAFALEPFGVPTGSMALTLIGNHREANCPRCGFPVRVGQPSSRGRVIDFEHSECPNCGQTVDLTKAPEVPGDRLLVDKCVYHARSPLRWEVAVFRCPVDFSKPYVKRVIGLPGEAVQIVDGDVYANGILLRKSLTQLRETCVPIFDMNHAPADGWGVRWIVEPVAADPKLPTVKHPTPPGPAGPDVLRNGILSLNAQTPGNAVGLTYRNWRLPEKDEDVIRDWLGYNGLMPEPRRTRPLDVIAPPVHDFLVEFDLEVLAGSGVFAVRLGDGADFVTADFSIGLDTAPGVRLAAHAESASNKAPALQEVERNATRLEPGRTYHCEFAFADRRASLAIDGDEVVPALDLPAKTGRSGVRRPLQLGARGVSVRVHNLRIGHDIHYRSEGRNATNEPLPLGSDEYFMLGDNSSDSHDSREWGIPGVPERDFLGKPFLIHQPMRLGRVTVNGQERTFQSVDWARLRWLR